MCSVSIRIPNEEAERGAIAADAEGQRGGQSLFPELHTSAEYSRRKRRPAFMHKKSTCGHKVKSTGDLESGETQCSRETRKNQNWVPSMYVQRGTNQKKRFPRKMLDHLQPPKPIVCPRNEDMALNKHSQQNVLTEPPCKTLTDKSPHLFTIPYLLAANLIHIFLWLCFDT